MRQQRLTSAYAITLLDKESQLGSDIVTGQHRDRLDRPSISDSLIRLTGDRDVEPFGDLIDRHQYRRRKGVQGRLTKDTT